MVAGLFLRRIPEKLGAIRGLCKHLSMARSDPRAEPTTNPPAKGSADHSVERVVVSKISASEDRAESKPASEPKSEPRIEVQEPPSVTRMITSEDPRLLEIEPLLETNDWRTAAAKLGPLEDAGKLPPNLGLIAAIAHNESTPEGSPEARALAIRCTAGLLGMPAESELARILARRILRKAAPVRLHERPAPPARQSAIIVASVVALGAALGWFLSTPYGARLLQTIVR
jgi:hypothetical protein